MKESRIVSSGKSMSIKLLSESLLAVDGEEFNIELVKQVNGISLLQMGNKIYEVYCKLVHERNYEIWIGHHIFEVSFEDKRSIVFSGATSRGQVVSALHIVKSPMPGLVTNIEIAVGDIVEIGQGLIILEAMKMENEIRSVTQGKVIEIKVSKSSRVEKDQPLLVIDPKSIK